MVFDHIATLVRDANLERDAATLDRRAFKLLEELGEVAQAYLAVTSQHNRKQKSWDDVREELADCLIVALDIAWTVLPGETDIAPPSYRSQQPLDFIQAISRISYQLALYTSSLGLRFNLARHAIERVIHFTAHLAFLPLPDQTDLSADAIAVQLVEEIERKLQKWAGHRAGTVTP